MKIGVVTFPGSNCDMDMVHALSQDLGFNVVQLWHKDRDLQGVEAVVLPGGFSYGDYLRSGAIARFSPIMEEVVSFAHGGGRVMGSAMDFKSFARQACCPVHSDTMKAGNSFVGTCTSSLCHALHPFLQDATLKRRL